jgi:hypothetical protein
LELLEEKLEPLDLLDPEELEDDDDLLELDDDDLLELDDGGLLELDDGGLLQLDDGGLLELEEGDGLLRLDDRLLGDGLYELGSDGDDKLDGK